MKLNEPWLMMQLMGRLPSNKHCTVNPFNPFNTFHPYIFHQYRYLYLYRYRYRGYLIEYVVSFSAPSSLWQRPRVCVGKKKHLGGWPMATHKSTPCAPLSDVA